jgi:hypothetical protein
MTELPLLDEATCTKVELKARDVFNIWFFNFECLRQSYEGLNYTIKRWIQKDNTGTEWNVIYKFPAVGDLEDTKFVFNSGDPFKNRHDISSHFSLLEQLFAHDRAVRNAKKVLSQLPAGDVDVLRTLNPHELQALINGFTK